MILKTMARGMLVLGLLAGCTPPEELDDEDLEPTENWHELMSNRGAVFEPNPAFEMPEIVLTPDRLAAMPTPLQQRPELAHFAVSRSMAAPVAYEGGVFGTVGNAKMFVGSSSSIGSYDRLYWVMVKVLSEKFGCFMVAKQNHPEKTWVKCRDKRQIVFWKSKGPGFVQFFARQFDREGYEIVVKKKKIVRVGTEKVL